MKLNAFKSIEFKKVLIEFKETCENDCENDYKFIRRFFNLSFLFFDVIIIDFLFLLSSMKVSLKGVLKSITRSRKRARR